MSSDPSDSLPPEQPDPAAPAVPAINYSSFDAEAKTTNIRSFASAMEAHLACLAIQGQGIPCMVVGEAVNANLSGYIVMKGGGVAVQVMEEDLERVQAILAKIAARRDARIAAAKHCPNCGGDDVLPIPSRRNRWAFTCFIATIVLLCFPKLVYIAFAVGIVGLYMIVTPAASRLHCSACGHSWPEPSDFVDENKRDDAANQ